jgi:hypothetical protein
MVYCHCTVYPSYAYHGHMIKYGGDHMNSTNIYQELVSKINKTLNRKAITVDQIKYVIGNAKNIRRTQGIMGLWFYATKIPSIFFSRKEIEQLKQSPYWKTFSLQMIDFLIFESVITSKEGDMLKRFSLKKLKK